MRLSQTLAALQSLFAVAALVLLVHAPSAWAQDDDPPTVFHTDDTIEDGPEEIDEPRKRDPLLDLPVPQKGKTVPAGTKGSKPPTPDEAFDASPTGAKKGDGLTKKG